jgi:hypothetical protein
MIEAFLHSHLDLVFTPSILHGRLLQCLWFTACQPPPSPSAP